MRTTIKLLFLIFIFGCKNQPKNEIESLPEIKTEKPKQQSTKTIFDLIINKEESPTNFTDSLVYTFDLSKRFTEKEVSVLNLDTTKIDLSEYYFLTNQKFLKKKIDSISFTIYYKHQYGDQLEKILRVKRKDTVFDITLSMKGGDSFSQSVSTEFVNQTTFLSTSLYREEDPDSNSFNTDSIISIYHYTSNFDFKLLDKVSYKIENNVISRIKNPFGRIKDFELFYDCVDCRTSITGGINIYATKNNSKIDLATVPIADFYIDDVKLIELKNEPFIFVHSSHTYGHSDGKLYSFDIDNVKLNQVNIKKSNYVIPDSLSIRKGFGLSIDEDNQFTTGYFLRSENNGNGYLITNLYDLIKVKENEYELVLINTELNESN